MNKTAAEQFASLIEFVSNRIEQARQDQKDKTEPLSSHVVWFAAADWVWANL